jgi:hypothetical protein
MTSRLVAVVMGIELVITGYSDGSTKIAGNVKRARSVASI